MRHFHWMTIDGKSSRDFEVYISGDGTYSSPERSYEEVEVPGRNGSIFLYDGNYKNIDVTYHAWIGKNEGSHEVDLNFRKLRSFLMSRSGYVRIEDTYHPDEFRFGAYNDSIDASVHPTFDAVEFDMTFSCKPQRFIKKFYDVPVVITESGYKFYNETYFDAKPLIRVHGLGKIIVNGTPITINTAEKKEYVNISITENYITGETTSHMEKVIEQYTDIDCELQEVYKDTLANNCNRNVALLNTKFPVLSPGLNEITFDNTITKVELYPRLFNL